MNTDYNYQGAHYDSARTIVNENGRNSQLGGTATLGAHGLRGANGIGGQRRKSRQGIQNAAQAVLNSASGGQPVGVGGGVVPDYLNAEIGADDFGATKGSGTGNQWSNNRKTSLGQGP